MDNSDKEVIIKYSSYTPAQKRATQKYRSNNKDKVNEQRKKYYQERKTKDENFLEYKRQKAREYYQRKKEANKPVEEVVEEVVEAEPAKEHITITETTIQFDENATPEQVREVIQEIKKRKRNNKKL